MKTEKVEVVPYQEGWQSCFQFIKAEILPKLEPLLLSVEHVGSTAVEGLASKPIIDIDLIIENDSQLPDVIDALAAFGYQYEGDLGIKGRYAFAYDKQEKLHLQEHHLYVCPKNSPELAKHLRFRDYLKANKEPRDSYAQVKLKADQAHPDDIDAYLNEKSDVINRIYQAIGMENLNDNKNI